MSEHISIQPGDELREAMRFWASGVAIVGAEFEGIRHGMTVSSFTSLSLEPPLVMVSLQKATRTHDLVIGSGAFGVTILAEGQEEISNLFAGIDNETDDRFSGLETYSLETGAPLLHNGLAFFDCRLVGQHDAGTHTVMIGEVAAAQVHGAGDQVSPLVYFNRDYRKLIGSGSPS
jgi:flavin reductase (DIM6/NTAB) family NADH-FMN oxidoreductase RutF